MAQLNGLEKNMRKAVGTKYDNTTKVRELSNIFWCWTLWQRVNLNIMAMKAGKRYEAECFAEIGLRHTKRVRKVGG